MIKILTVCGNGIYTEKVLKYYSILGVPADMGCGYEYFR